MKKVNLILAASALILAGASSLAITKAVTQSGNTYKDVFAETVENDTKDFNETGVSGIGIHQEVNDDALAVSPSMGVQVSDVNENGTRSLRFIASVSDPSSILSATFERTMNKNDGSTYKYTESFPVTTVYTSVADKEDALFPDDFVDEGYYAVYTMNNIPEDYWYYALNVKLTVKDFSGNTTVVSQSANVKGVLGDPSHNIGYMESTSNPGEYWAFARRSSSSWAAQFTTDDGACVVSEDYMTTEGYVATYHGKVTALENESSSYGAFEGASYLTSITLPDTITSFDSYCFSKCTRLTTMTLPRDLVKINSSALSSVTPTAVYWNAKNLETISSYFSADIDTVYVNKDVETLPNARLTGSSYKVNKVVYGGTEAEWASLIAGKTSSDLNIDNVMCSDTVTCTITVHLNGGTMTYANETKEEDFAITVIQGKAFPSFAAAKKDGYFFLGWYTDEECTNALADDAKVTGNTDLYASFSDTITGMDFANAIEINEASYKTTVVTQEGMDYAYFKFTAPAADRYYFNIPNYSVDEYVANDSGRKPTSASPALFVYANDDDHTAYTSKSFSFANTDKVQTIASSAYHLAVDCEAGEVIYVAATLYYSSSTYYAGCTVHGSLDMTVSTVNGDTTSEAMDYTWGTDQTVGFVNSSDVLVYKWTSDHAGQDLLSFTSTGSLYGTAKVYKQTETGVEALNTGSYDVSGTTSGVKIITVEDGATYYVVCTTNANAQEGKAFSFKVGETPAGSSATNTLDLAVGETVTVSMTGLQYQYYKVTVEDEDLYLAEATLATGVSSYGSKSVQIFAASDTTCTTTVSTNTTAYSSTAATAKATLAPGDYIIRVGYTSSGYTGNMSLTFKKVAAGDDISKPLTLEDGASVTVGSNTSDYKYYQFTGTAENAGDYKYKATSTVSGSVIVYSRTADATTNTKVGTYSMSSSSAASFNITVAEGTTYIFGFKTSDSSEVTLTKEIYVAPLTGKAYVDKQFNGTCKGSSYYKINFTAAGLSWEGGATGDAFDIETTEGYDKLTLTGSIGSLSSGATIYVDGTDCLAFNGSYTYYLSANNTNYSSSSTSTNAGFVKTSDTTISSGAFSSGANILCATNDVVNSCVRYSAVINGQVYLGCTVTFTDASTATAIKTTGAIYTITAANGTSLGTWTTTASNTMAAYTAE